MWVLSSLAVLLVTARRARALLAAIQRNVDSKGSLNNAFVPEALALKNERPQSLSRAVANAQTKSMRTAAAAPTQSRNTQATVGDVCIIKNVPLGSATH